jgi:hypothetical protein
MRKTKLYVTLHKHPEKKKGNYMVDIIQPSSSPHDRVL